ncbi:MAG TPA: Rne/Rng family ribonuclease [Terriglobales bacterium]
MSKELFVSSTPHETKVAIVEDDLLSEIYYERENEYTLAGSIYKGRVTRVLPGMQSAFVDIGLERDAFLYVSDFLEQTGEDDDEFEQIPVPAGQVIVSNRANGSQVEEAEEEAALGNEQAGEQETTEGEAQKDQEPRRWRGRRSRRRGGKGGLPESKFVPQSGASEASQPTETAPHETIVLPGESLAKYGQSAESNSQKRAEESPRQVNESPAAREVAPASVSEQKSPEISGWDGGLTLPGESISKYRPREEGSSAISETPAVEERRSSFESRRSSEKRRTERHHEPAPSGPAIFALPGESISKYKGSAAESQPAPAAEEQDQQHSVTTPERSEQAASDHLEAIAEVSENPSPSFFAHEEKEPAERPAQAKADYRAVRFETPQAEDSSSKVEHLEEPATEAASAESEPSAPAETDLSAQPSATTDSENAAAPQAFAPGAGHIEEEIIEEEEIEPELLVESYEDSLYDELEEETIEAEAGEDITGAVRDSQVEEPTGTADAEYEGEDPEPVEAAEMDTDEGASAEEDSEDQGDDEEFADRAEVRAPAATAGFQQRQERSGPAERRGRRRFQKRRVHARRNIQRASMPTISELLKEGQEVLVQIAKEPIAKKGARITSHIALPGRFLVYMPTVNHVGVSRKIGSDEERQRLKRILISEKGNAHGGFIVRTAAAGASEEELRADIRFLINLWNEIKGRSDSSKAPALIYHDLNLVERVLRDLVNTSFSSIWVDTEQEYERIVRFLNRFQPSLLKKVKLYTKETPLFEQFGIQEEINKALKSKVWLKSGGYIVINQTEALVAVDINTGKFVGKTARLEDTIVKTNLDAIKEIVRQIRLRDLGGIIVIDFIDMDERKNRQKVMQGLEDALRSDRSPSKVLQFNDFGLVAITRKRVKQSLERTLGAPCTYCTGTGMIKSVQTICNEIYVEMRKMAKHLEHHDVMLRVHPEVVKGLKEKGGRWLQEMEELTGKTIIVKSDPTLHQEQFDIN